MLSLNRKEYSVTFDGVTVNIADKQGKNVYGVLPGGRINTLKAKDELNNIKLIDEDESTWCFIIQSGLYDKKLAVFRFEEKVIEYQVTVESSKEVWIDTIDYIMETDKSQIEKIYVPRFDWKLGKVYIRPHEEDTLGCQQWLSPPPFCYGLKMDTQWIACGIGPKVGEYNFLSFDYLGSEDKSLYQLTYEGHTKVSGQFTTPKLILRFGEEEENKSIAGFIDYMRDQGMLAKPRVKEVPKWWKEPIFCGWGEMRYDYRRDHDGRENGTFINVTRYATEATYRHYVNLMEEKGINPGTIIIDMGWAKKPALGNPCDRRWIDLRRFIDEQHEKGRKVLLWYTPVVSSGLSNDQCMTLDGRPIAPDPTNPLYEKTLNDQIKMMLSSEEGCLNGDGFKIDFTQNTPSENGVFRNYLTSFWGLIQDDGEEDNPYIYPKLEKRKDKIKTYGNLWGVELLKKYIELIYIQMKKVKSDSVLITHTANPYFADVVDVLRLNDLDGDCDNVLDIMKNRYEISKMCNPYWLIDTDNDLMYDKEKWRDYIQLQPKLGIPDTYYISGIATSMESFDKDDYDLLKGVWKAYREENDL